MTNPNIFHHAFVVFCWCSIGTMLAGRNLLWERSVSGAEEQQYFAGSGCVVSGPVCGGLLRSLGLWPGLVFERRCYVLSCQRKENCQPKQRPGTDSLLAFLQRGPPPTLVLQSLVRGESFPNHWQPLPRHRGSEDPMKDLALLEGIQDLDNTDAEYAESFRSLEDKRAEDRDAATVEQEDRPGLYDWPVVQGKEEFNQSETERVGERLTTVQGPLESSPFPPSYFPEMRNESKSSLIDADSDVTPPVITTLNTRVIVTDSCILFSDIVKTLKMLGVSRDALNWAKVYHSFHKNVKQHNCFQYYCNNKKKCFLSTKSTY